jgi:hypothetical protein
MTAPDFLHGYELTGCTAFDANLVCLWGLGGDVDDPLEEASARVFFHYADEPLEDRWAFRHIGETTGLFGCAAHVPTREWVFVTEDGQVTTVSSAGEGEAPPVTEGRAFFSNAKVLHSGEVVAVGGRRKVFLRGADGRFQRWGEGLFPDGPDADMGDAGFRDVAGFGPDEIYAVGGRGDAWVCRTGQWERIDLGTNASLQRVTCSRDGRVVIAANRDLLFVGRGTTFEPVRQQITDEVHESLVDFEGRVLLSTVRHILEVRGNEIVPASLGRIPELPSFSRLGSGRGVLVVAGRSGAATYDGTEWTVLCGRSKSV